MVTAQTMQLVHAVIVVLVTMGVADNVYPWVSLVCSFHIISYDYDTIYTKVEDTIVFTGISQPLSGKLSGSVSVGDTKAQLNNVDIHGFAVVGEGRVYISISPVPAQAGWALMVVSPLVSIFGWLFALELQNHPNGFSITGIIVFFCFFFSNLKLHYIIFLQLSCHSTEEKHIFFRC